MGTLQRNPFRVRLFQRAKGIFNLLAGLPNLLIPPPFRLIQIGSAYWQSRALCVAADLYLADALGDQELTAIDIAGKLDLHADHLHRLLRMLASIGVFDQCGDDRFRNNRLSAYLRLDHPQSVRAMILMHNSPELTHAWCDSLGPSMRSGEVPFRHSHGQELFAYMDSHPEFDDLFTEAMEAVEGLIGTDYLRDFDWGQFSRIIDVAGSNGNKTVAVLQHHPKLRALVFDRPKVIDRASDHWCWKLDPSVFKRIDFVGGDMLQTIPAAESPEDLFLFAAVFHGLGDEEAKLVLTNLKQACGTHRPTIVIADAVAQEQGIDPTIAAFDMQMLVGTRGRERTLTEWRDLLQSCEFSIHEAVDVRTFAKLLVVKPNS